MRLWFFIVTMLLRNLASRNRRLLSNEVSLWFTALPWECDENFHLNNASYLIAMDICRKELMLRSGFLEIAVKERWHGPVSSQAVVYLRPIPFLKRYEVKTTIESADENSVSIRHVFWREGKVCAEGLVRCMVKKGRVTLSPIQILQTLGINPQRQEKSPNCQSLESIDKSIRSLSKST